MGMERAKIDKVGGFWNGTFDEFFNALVTSNGSTVTMSLEKSGGGDLTMNFSDGKTTLDTTPALEIVLTAGSDPNPTDNFIYILKSDKRLIKSISNWPTEEHLKVGFFFVPSAPFVENKGVYVNQNWNEDKQGTDLQGDLSHIGERFRRMGAQYFSGVDGNGTTSYLTITTNAGSADNVVFKSTAGIVYQKHEHVVPAMDTSGSDILLVINDSSTAFNDITDLNVLLTDASGNSMSGKYFNLVFIGVVNKSGEFVPFMVNLPTGSYSRQSDAENDVSGFSVTAIPSAFNRESSTGFEIAEITLRHQPASSGTWTHVKTKDLRGLSAAGAGAGVSALDVEFADNVFKIFDESDVTKELAFQLSSITTGNTRTVTMADRDLDLATPVFDSVTLGATTLVSSILDEDDLVSNSATALATQQSIKAYADAITSAYTRTATQVVAASNSKDTTNADHFCDGTDDQVQINAAIDALPAGGGAVLLMEGTYSLRGTIQIDVSNTALIGIGKSVKLVADWKDAPMITAGAVNGILIHNLFIFGFGSWTTNVGIEFNDTTDSEISQCHFSNCVGYTINILTTSSRIRIVNNFLQSSSSGNNVLILQPGVTRCLVEGNITNTGNGYQIGGNNNMIVGNVINGITANSSGLILSGSDNMISANTITNNKRNGILLGAGDRNMIVGNIITGNDSANTATYNGIIIQSDADDNFIANNIIRDNDNFEILLKDVATGNNMIIQNKLDGTDHVGAISDTATNTFIGANLGLTVVELKDLIRMKNTSGGTIFAGDLVVLKAVAAGDEVTTTTTQGDDAVFGMVAEQIGNNTSGLIHVGGKTTALKVDGTTDIAIGDFIGTFTTAGIGMKAAAGDMAIAIALEAYTTDDSSGVIDALFITPRKI